MRSRRIQFTSLDGRWVALGCIAVYFTALFVIRHFLLDRQEAWKILGVPGMNPSFLDARGIIAAATSAREGFDPILNNPYDPLLRPANYPHLWYWPLLVFNIHNNSATKLGVGLALMFYACVMLFLGKVRLREGFIWGFFLCAPPTMLAVERGNNDLVIFILLSIALIARRFSAVLVAISYSLVSLCAALKLYPFTVFCLATREKSRTAWIISTTASLACITYLYLIREQIKYINKVLPHPYMYAYGYRVLTDQCNAYTHEIIPWFTPVLAILVVFVLAGWMRVHAPSLPEMPQLMVDSLMTGSILYVFTFALNSNSNYRMIFLLFTIPALLHLSEGKTSYRSLAKVMLGCMSVGWALSCQMLSVIFFIKETANWTVFAGMTFLWLECLPFPKRPSFMQSQSTTK